VSTYKELRERTQREMALAGNHWDAISRHLDAYEAAYAHELAEKQRREADDLHQTTPGVVRGLRMAADLIDPKKESTR
jgi:hypothetical protein